MLARLRCCAKNTCNQGLVTLVSIFEGYDTCRCAMHVSAFSLCTAKDVVNESIRHTKVKETKRFKRPQEENAPGAASADGDGGKKKQDARASAGAATTGAQAVSADAQKDKAAVADRRDNHASKWMSRRSNTLAKVNLHLLR